MTSSFSPDTSLNKKSILITGCSSGIGRDAALTLRARGYNVIATARREEDVAALREEGLFALTLDLDDSASIQNAWRETLEYTGGGIHALFNNGAYGLPGAVEDLSREALRAQFETNLFGWLELTNLVIPVMRRQCFGRIVQDSSILGLVALPYRGAYCASKFALEGLCDALRLELHGSGVHVSLIEPGPIATRFRANALRAFQRDIDVENSAHRKQYEAVLGRLNKEGAAMPFTLPPSAVTQKLIQALESRRPRARYYVTFPSYLFGYLRRVLSSRQLDWLALKVSGGGRT